jgi:4-carboxymuconolactone decarboxylase
VALQNYLFVGYPRAITALQTLSRCARDEASVEFHLDPTPPRHWAARGRALCRDIYGEHYESLLIVMKRTHPELADWMIREGYGKVLARPYLGPRVRELCVIALLAAQESWPQLRSHLAGALRVGAKRGEAREAVETGLRMAPEADAREARSVVEDALR